MRFGSSAFRFGLDGLRSVSACCEAPCVFVFSRVLRLKADIFLQGRVSSGNLGFSDGKGP